MKVLIQTLGSAGDTFPFIGIGSALVARRHDVVLFANEVFRPSVEAAGLTFVEMGDAASYMDLAANSAVWDARRGIELILKAVVDHLDESIEIIEAELDGADVIVSSSLGFGARMVRDIHGTPLVIAHLAPSLLRSSVRLPRTEVMLVGDNSPSWVKSLWWRLGDFLVDRVAGPELNSVRQKYGLPPVKRILDEWSTYSPDRTLGLFPEWFGPPQPDWKRPVTLTGFPLYDGSDLDELDRSLDAWLSDGPPPVVFTAGSANYQAAEFFDVARNVAAELGLKSLFVTPSSSDLPDLLPMNVRSENFVPFSKLLPRSRALISHGGVGTCAQALAAGIPHLVAHLNFDQRDNASRLEDLGTGFGMPISRFAGSTAVDAVDSLLSDRYRARAEAVSSLVDRDRSLREACLAIEESARR
ncbi:glycosyltransferase [soil metagenome]